MPRAFAPAGLATALVCSLVPALGATSAAALPRTHQCQRPVRTGVEVWGLRNIAPARACPPALALFAWENARPSHARALYGCRRPKPEEAGTPFLKLHEFRGWRLSLTGRYKEFTMSRGNSSFHVGGTDFPLNCT